MHAKKLEMVADVQAGKLKIEAIKVKTSKRSGARLHDEAGEDHAGGFEHGVSEKEA